MCVMSVVMDGFNDRWQDKLSDLKGFQLQWPPQPEVNRAEFDKLREEVMALKDMLKAAKIYDEKTGQPDCESEDKMAKARQICKLVGLDLDSLIAPRQEDGK